MAEVHLTQLLIAYWPAIAGLLFASYLVSAYFHKGLNRYPGPWLANFTDAWRAWDLTKNRHQYTLIELHKRYGPVVRTGPNTLDIADPDLVPAIYGLHKGFTKTKFYFGFQPLVKGKPLKSIFTHSDERAHTALKRPVAGMYTLSHLQSYEPLVDDMIRLFVDRVTTEFADSKTQGKPCDMAQWLQYMALDLILHLTFGNTMGFLENGQDMDGFIAFQLRNSYTSSLISQMPWLRHILRETPWRRIRSSDSTIAPGFVRKHIAEHQAKLAANEHTKVNSEKIAEDGSGAGEYGDDFLTRFLLHPKLTIPDSIMYSLANVMAGADTTSVTLRAIIYFLLKNPTCLQKLMVELRAQNPPLSYPVTWKESQQLPYLNAVVHESMRIFPAIGLSLERAVPETGLELPDGTTLPKDVHVGMNAWVVHRSEKIYGPDPETYRPERWLRAEGEPEDAFEARLSAMKKSDMTFGYNGSKRVCLGRNISYLEIYKFIPTLLLEFEIGLIDPDKEWEVKNRMFVHQKDMDCWLKRRVR